MSLDPKAMQFPEWSPYNYVMGNPIALIDANGKAPGRPLVTITIKGTVTVEESAIRIQETATVKQYTYTGNSRQVVETTYSSSAVLASTETSNASGSFTQINPFFATPSVSSKLVSTYTETQDKNGGWVSNTGPEVLLNTITLNSPTDKSTVTMNATAKDQELSPGETVRAVQRVLGNVGKDNLMQSETLGAIGSAVQYGEIGGAVFEVGASVLGKTPGIVPKVVLGIVTVADFIMNVSGVTTGGELDNSQDFSRTVTFSERDSIDSTLTPATQDQTKKKN